MLTAMQQVEDNLAALRIMAEEAGKVRQTVQAAKRALDVSSAQHRAGTAGYLTVITSQATLLTADVTAVMVALRVERDAPIAIRHRTTPLRGR